MEIYQAKQNEILHGLKGVAVIADDILVYGKGNNEEEAMQDHNENLLKLMQRLKIKNSKLNCEKTKLCQSEVKFYGHVLTSSGMKPDPSKISTISNMQAPKSKEELGRFLGMVSYLGKFIKNLSDKADILRKLTHDNAEFIWQDEHDKAFKDLQKATIESPTLRYFNVNKPLVIQADASSFALGATIMQSGHPISYASKVLTTSQRNYSQIEKEMLAIVFACKRFDQYICGKNDVIVETDHQPLIKIMQRRQLTETPKRLQSMLMSLQRYNLQLKYIKGSEMYIADFLSRLENAPSGETEKEFEIYKLEQDFEQVNVFEEMKIKDITLQKIKAETENDKTFRELRDIIIKGWPDNCNKLQNCLKDYWKYKEDLTTHDGIIIKSNRIVVPPSMRSEILEILHSNHQGIEYTTKFARQTVFWPNIKSHINDKIARCSTCLKYAPKQQNPPMLSHDVPKSPFERVSIDICELVINEKNRKFLITVDHYSDYFEIDELKDMKSKTIIDICRRNFSRHGIPIVCVSDNGTNLVSNEFKKFADEWEFTIKTSSPHHQQGNGKTEAAVSIAKLLIKKSIESGGDFYKNLLQLRNMSNKNEFSPAQRLFARRTRCSVPTISKMLLPQVPRNVSKQIENQRRKTKKYYDRKSKQLPQVIVGRKVMAKVNHKSKEWQEATVEKEDSPNSYWIRTNNDSVYRRSRVDIKPIPEAIEIDNINNSATLNNEPVPSQSPAKINHENSTSVSTPKNHLQKFNQTNNNIPPSSQNHRFNTRPKRTIKMPEKYKDYEC